MKQNFFTPYIICMATTLLSSGALAHGIQQPSQTQQYPYPESSRAFIEQFLVPAANAKAAIRVSEADGYRYIEADGLPNHQTGRFPNRNNPHSIQKQSYSYRIPLAPKPRPRPKELGHNPFGIAINGVLFDPLTAEYWRNNRQSGWNIDALGGGMNLGTDESNAHVQPNGAYHYHGIPHGLVETLAPAHDRVLIGYAADGYPIYSPTKEDKSSYVLKQGTRPDGPGGTYDGTYTADYIYSPDAGSLDQCNGRSGMTAHYPNGTYYYVVTEAFPNIPRCHIAEPDSSFQRRPERDSARPTDNRPNINGPNNRRSTGTQGGGMQRGGHPDLNAAAQKLGISVGTLRRALGPPPPDFEAAAQKLGISADDLFNALHGQ